MTYETLSDDDRKKVEEIWARVFYYSNRVVLQHQKFGIHGMELLPHPSIEEMVTQLKVLGGMIDGLLSSPVDVGYDATRLLLNAQRQITSFLELALALEANDRQGCQAAIDELDRQAAF